MGNCSTCVKKQTLSTSTYYFGHIGVLWQPSTIKVCHVKSTVDGRCSILTFRSSFGVMLFGFINERARWVNTTLWNFLDIAVDCENTGYVYTQLQVFRLLYNVLQ